MIKKYSRKKFFRFLLSVFIFNFLKINFAHANEVIVWNVGQGQWITKVSKSSCQHFDIGGEFTRLPRVLKICQGKSHQVFISHLDWDHISFLGRLANSVKDICLLNDPLVPLGKDHFKKFYQIPACEKGLPNNYVTLFSGQASKISNQTSAVIFLQKNRFLLPGDSPKNLEKKWRYQVPEKTRVLVLGHHGSKTSNSKKLLDEMPRLKMAVASARSQRYGHPHPEVERNLQVRSIPLLRTEDWGNLRFKE